MNNAINVFIGGMAVGMSALPFCDGRYFTGVVLFLLGILNFLVGVKFKCKSR